MQALVRLFGVLLMLSALAVSLTHAPDRSVESLVARWAPPPSDFMLVKGQLVHFRDEGPRDDPLPLVLLHDVGGSLHTWQGWIGELHARKRVITFDLPGSGLTGPFIGSYPQDDYRADTLARFTLDVLNALHVQRVAIGGNSLGGEVAWRLAATAPARVDRLILVDASGYAIPPESVPPEIRLDRTPIIGWIGESLTPRAVIDESLRELYGDPTRVTSALVDRYFELLTREGNRHALRVRLQQAASDLAPERVAALKVPTLILWGGRDRLTPLAAAKAFQHDIAGSRLVVFPALGHMPQEEDAPQSVAPVLPFLGLDSTPARPHPLPAAPSASEPA